jgi:hypothetical protein
MKKKDNNGSRKRKKSMNDDSKRSQKFLHNFIFTSKRRKIIFR